MRPFRARHWPAMVVLASLVAACSANSAGDGAAPPPTPASAPSAQPAAPGTPAGPAIPTTTPPFAKLTPGRVTDTGGVQQVLITGGDSFFGPGVFHVRPGRVRVIFRNDDPSNVHNLVFPDSGRRTADTLPGQASSVTVVLSKPGLYDFICSYHNLTGMHGQVKVG